METALAIAILSAIGYWAYTQGKRFGSRGGFRAGWRRGRGFGSKPK